MLLVFGLHTGLAPRPRASTGPPMRANRESEIIPHSQSPTVSPSETIVMEKSGQLPVKVAPFPDDSLPSQA